MSDDVTGMTDEHLAELRLSVLAEMDRRSRVEQAPTLVATAVADARQVGLTEVEVRAVVDTTLSEGAA